MSIRTKLILINVAITFCAILPFSRFLLMNQETNTLARVLKQGKTIANILSHSTLNILMMNGGEISSSSVDVKDMIKILSTLKSEGLVYADAVLLSSNREHDGLILGSIVADEQKYRDTFRTIKKVSPDDLIKIRKKQMASGRCILVLTAKNIWDFPPSA